MWKTNVWTGTNIQQPNDVCGDFFFLFSRYFFFFFLLLLLLPLLTSRGDDALAVTMTHPFDTLIIISSHLIRLTSPGEFRLGANMKFSSSLTPAYPQMKMSICLHVNLLQKEAVFFLLLPHCVHCLLCFVSPWRIRERKVVGSCCPLLDIKGRPIKKREAAT